MSYAFGGKAAPNPEREIATSAPAAACLMRRARERARGYVVRIQPEDVCRGCHHLRELRFGYCYGCVYPYLHARCGCDHDFRGHLEDSPASGPVCLGEALDTSTCRCPRFQPSDRFGRAVVLALGTLDS